jgi:hypothetical protein
MPVAVAFEFESDTSLASFFNRVFVASLWPVFMETPVAAFPAHICGNAMHIIRIEEESWTVVIEEKYADFYTVRLIPASEYSIA